MHTLFQNPQGVINQGVTLLLIFMLTASAATLVLKPKFNKYAVILSSVIVWLLCTVHMRLSFKSEVLEFIEFDKNTNKKVTEIDVYYSIPEFLTLCEMIRDRTLIGMIKADKQRCIQNNIKYSDGRLCAKRGGGVVDNQVKYRENYFCSASSPKMDGMMVAEIMDGVKNQQGLINPKLTNNAVTNKHIVRVPFLFPDLYNMAMIGLYRIQAFLTAKQLRGCFDRVRQEGQGYEEVQNVQPQEEVQNYQTDVQPQYSQGYQGQPSNENMDFNADQAFYESYAAQYGYTTQ